MKYFYNIYLILYTLVFFYLYIFGKTLDTLTKNAPRMQCFRYGGSIYFVKPKIINCEI
jgi:hypothetical protein